MPGDRPTLFNPFLLSLGVLRWQRVGWLQWGGRGEGGEQGRRGRRLVLVKEERVEAERAGFGGPHEKGGESRVLSPHGLCE